MMRPWRMALRSVRQDWRGGELRILAVSLAVAVASVTAVVFFTERVQRAMEAQATELLAADLVVLSSSPIRTELQDKAHALGLRHASTVDFPSVIVVKDDTLLVQVKAVSPNYPLRGQLRIAERSQGEAFATREIPAAGDVWADARLLDRFDLTIGVRVELGASEFKIAKVLDYEPDRGGQLFRLAPRVMMNLQDLDSTGLVSANSRVRYRLLLAGPAQAISRYQNWFNQQRMPEEELRGIHDGRPEIRTSLERAQRYLGLAALVAVLVAGAAIALATRHYVERQMDASAIMRCLGAQQKYVIQVYAWRLLFIGLAASLVGCFLGYGAQQVLASLLQGWFVESLPQPGLGPLVVGLITGLVTLAGFAFPPLWRLRQVPPLRVMRRDLDEAPPSVWAAVAFAFMAFAALLIWQTRGSDMGIAMILGTSIFLAGLWLISVILISLARRFQPRTGMIWRYGAMRLLRRQGSSVLQISGFAVGIAALLVLAVTRVDLLNLWRQGLPEDAPNYFLINIQYDERDAMADLFRSQGVTTSVYYPIVRGRLVAINAQAANPADYDSPRAKRLLNREFNLTWTDKLPSDNRITDGRWWGEQGHEVREFSVEKDIAKALGIERGDTLRYRIAGLELEAKVTSLREVDWDSFNPNFFVIASPRLLEASPAQWMTSFYLEPGRRSVMADLARRFPSVTVIDIGTIMQQVRSLMDRAALAIEYVFLFTLAAGILVMHAAIQASQSERRQETALVRALGGNRKQVLTGLLVEFATIGLLAGALAALVASIAGHLLATEVFGLVYQANPWLWIWGMGGGCFGIAVAGLLGTLRVLNQSPAYVLQRS